MDYRKGTKSGTKQKRFGEMKEAFNQINRYQKHSFGAGKGLFHFVQIIRYQ